jgi:hypothetical protein
VYDDLAQRWRRARCAALCRTLGQPARDQEEQALLARALLAQTDLEPLMRRVFEHSLGLGRGFSRFYGTELELLDLPRALPLLGGPCLKRTCAPANGEAALRLWSEGCPVQRLGPVGCDFYREALAGLLLGLTGNLLLSRHASRGHGDRDCVDVVHEDPESPVRFGPIAPELQAGLLEIAQTVRLFDSSAAVEFLGVSEGVLHYRCRQGAQRELSLRSLVERGARRRFPKLELCEVSARPVLAMERS